MTRLAKMLDDDFKIWNAQVWVKYRAELIAAGITEAAADENVASNMAQTFPEGKLAAGNFVFAVWHDEQKIGAVWLADRAGEWFIYDIEVDENLRGQGLGRATMRSIEDFVRSQEGISVSLSVFGFNKIAQNLYLSEGYETVRWSMTKKLID
ncbi:MAG: GNAT family N-acetyltransferase [Actinomycetes bacterium]